MVVNAEHLQRVILATGHGNVARDLETGNGLLMTLLLELQYATQFLGGRSCRAAWIAASR